MIYREQTADIPDLRRFYIEDEGHPNAIRFEVNMNADEDHQIWFTGGYVSYKSMQALARLIEQVQGAQWSKLYRDMLDSYPLRSFDQAKESQNG